MDPQAAWKLANDSSMGFNERLDAIEGLIELIERGGFNWGVSLAEAKEVRTAIVVDAANDVGLEIFEHDGTSEAGDCWADDDGAPLPAGWYYWSCQPGCLPDSDPMGGHETLEELIDELAELVYEQA